MGTGASLIRDGTVSLRDGRALAFAEWGDPAGMPVLHFHGIPGSRLERHANDRIYLRLGLRYVTADRPGYGRSDPLRGRTFLDWARDVEQLVDHLGIEKFRVVGVSGGGPFALATARELSERIDRVAIVSGVGPSDRPGALDGMELMERLTYWASPRFPRSTAMVSRFVFDGSARASELLARAASHAGKTVAVRADAALRLVEPLRESMRQGAAASVWENALCARPWGFDLADVSADVHLWHGDRDRVCPLHHAEHLAAALPRVRLTVQRGGHLLVLRCMEDVLRALAH
ncbi:MAG: alpha/beta fold hydrolase [Actinomycetota bacterium]